MHATSRVGGDHPPAVPLGDEPRAQRLEVGDPPRCLLPVWSLGHDARHGRHELLEGEGTSSRGTSERWYIATPWSSTPVAS
jgi:hypothetical protein